MKRTMKKILPILLSLVVICSIIWYLFVYDRGFMQDVLLGSARFFEQQGNHGIATWLYNQAYLHSGNSDSVIIELAERFKKMGNYTQAEVVLTRAIAENASVDLYVALSKTYVEQDKLMDAAKMLDNITNEDMKAQLDTLRPALPVPSHPKGTYTEYISVTFEPQKDTTLYISRDNDFPSLENKYQEGITLAGGPNKISAVAVNDLGLVSSSVNLYYTIGGVIEEITISDPVLDSHFREILNVPANLKLNSSDLWVITSLTVPQGVTNYEDIRRLTYLETLVMEDLILEDLSMLVGLTQLKSLTIRNCPLSAKDLHTLTDLTSLENLTLQNCSLSNISALSNMEGLISLDLSNNAIQDLSGLSFMENLTTLNLSGNALTSLNALSALEALTTLDVSYNSLTSILPLSSCKSLSILIASNNQLNGVPLFNDTTVLTVLDLSENDIADINNLAEYTALTKLYLAHNSIVDVSPLSGLKKLTVVNFSHNQITTLPTWDKACDLVEINGSYNAITSVAPLKGLMKLNNVYMDYNKITNVNPLADCRMLVRVSVYGNDIKDVSKLKDMSVIVNYDPT